MPISRTRKDYIVSGVVLFLIAAASVLAVYFTNPLKLRTNATTDILGITFPNFQGIIMRQPRMTVVLVIAVLLFFTAFVFIARPALPFFSRPISWISIGISTIGLLGIWFLTDDGRHSAWFRFFVLCLVFTFGATLLAEIMIFYRRLIHDWQYRSNFFHRLAFAVVCTFIAGAMASSYFHFAVKNGIFLDYGASANTVQTPVDIPTTPTTPGDSATTLPATENTAESVTSAP